MRCYMVYEVRDKRFECNRILQNGEDVEESYSLEKVYVLVVELSGICAFVPLSGSQGVHPTDYVGIQHQPS
jgi:hypothetical protein